MDRLDTIDQIVEQYCVSSKPLLRNLYFGLGLLFLILAVIGLWVPGWPTVSWAVPAAFLFSYSSESMFRWTLTNQYFGAAMFDYYSTGKTVPKHVKIVIILLIFLMSLISATFVWYVSTLGSGRYTDPSSWDGADPGFGATTILIVGIFGMAYVGMMVQSRG